MNPYVNGSSDTYYYQFVFNAYHDPVMLSYSPIKHAEFSAIKKGFEEDAARCDYIFDRPYESLGFTEIQNHTFCTIKCNEQNIDPGMVALFAAIFKKNSYSPALKMDPDSRPIFGCNSSTYELYPPYIKKNIFFMDNISFIEGNKDSVYIMENPDKEAGQNLLALLKYCKEGNEFGFPLNKNADRYYNPLNHSKELLKVYERFYRDPEMFEETLERDSLLLTYKVSQKIIKEAAETSKKMKMTLK